MTLGCCADEVFKWILLSRTLDGDTMIEWELQPSYEPVGVPLFDVQWSLSGLTVSDDWQTLNVAPLSTYNYIHSTTAADLYKYDQGPHYRVIMYDGGETHYSQPILWGTQFEHKRDWLQYREIIRRFCVDFRKGDGQYGLLLKRRNWGEKCTACTDWDTGEVTNSNCTTCYGTGIVGGYFEPVEFWTKLLDSSDLDTKNADGLGMVSQLQHKRLAVATPYLEARDVWVDLHADKRFFIHAVTPMEHVRDRPVVVAFEVRLADPTNIIYRVPLTSNSSSSSSSTP